LLVEETGVPREYHWPIASHWQTLSRLPISGIHTHNFIVVSLVIGTDCAGNCESNYHTIMTTTAQSHMSALEHNGFLITKICKYNKIFFLHREHSGPFEL
jgi:hypothetical protein